MRTYKYLPTSLPENPTLCLGGQNFPIQMPVLRTSHKIGPTPQPVGPLSWDEAGDCRGENVPCPSQNRETQTTDQELQGEEPEHSQGFPSDTRSPSIHGETGPRRQEPDESHAVAAEEQLEPQHEPSPLNPTQSANTIRFGMVGREQDPPQRSSDRFTSPPSPLVHGRLNGGMGSPLPTAEAGRKMDRTGEETAYQRAGNNSSPVSPPVCLPRTEGPEGGDNVRQLQWWPT